MTEKQKRREEVLSLLKKGIKPKDIHTMTGYDKTYIYSLSSRYKKACIELDENTNTIIEDNKEDDYVQIKKREYMDRQNKQYEFYEEIADMLKQQQQIIDTMSETYDEVGKLNKEIQHELRKLERCNNDDELMIIAKKIYCLRNERRISMTKHKLSISLKESFSSQKIRYTGLEYVADSFLQSINESKESNDPTRIKKKTHIENRISKKETYETELESPTGQDYLGNDDMLDEWKQSLRTIIKKD